MLQACICTFFLVRWKFLPLSKNVPSITMKGKMPDNLGQFHPPKRLETMGLANKSGTDSQTLEVLCQLS